jgi:hypothetical protein
MAAEVRHVADLFEGILAEDKGTGLHPLEAGEDDEGVLAVVGGGGGLGVDADVAELLDFAC